MVDSRAGDNERSCFSAGASALISRILRVAYEHEGAQEWCVVDKRC